MSYAQLTREERYVIAHLKAFKLSVREIARRLNRHHSNISPAFAIAVFVLRAISNRLADLQPLAPDECHPCMPAAQTPNKGEER
jgi:hypothetical protein